MTRNGWLYLGHGPLPTGEPVSLVVPGGDVVRLYLHPMTHYFGQFTFTSLLLGEIQQDSNEAACLLIVSLHCKHGHTLPGGW